MNPLDPNLMTTRERLGTICEILARGIVRLRLRDATETAADTGESSLHFAPARSGHANANRPKDAAA